MSHAVLSQEEQDEHECVPRQFHNRYPLAGNGMLDHERYAAESLKAKGMANEIADMIDVPGAIAKRKQVAIRLRAGHIPEPEDLPFIASCLNIGLHVLHPSEYVEVTPMPVRRTSLCFSLYVFYYICIHRCLPAATYAPFHRCLHAATYAWHMHDFTDVCMHLASFHT